jgi:hypothetical protein
MDWSFLEAVLRAFGFNHKVVHLLMQCVCSVQFTLLLNGGIWSNFFPSCGLIQGDPLSPYLFILGSEVILRLLNRKVQQGFLMGVKLGNSAPLISKLCYADDVILLCRARMDDVQSLMSCINTYCAWSGQMVSIEKSGAFYSKGVHTQFQKQVKCLWCLKTLPQSTKYLCVPLFLSHNRKKDFSYVKEKLESKTSCWKSKSLSWMGRATLIKSVAMAIPSYSMAAFQLPKSLYKDMDSCVKRFWWAPKKEAPHYYAPTAWKNICTPVQEGGLGFRTFWNLNQACLAKLAWWVLSKKDSICIQVLHAKYKVRSNWLNHKSGFVVSWSWKSIENSKSILSKGAYILVGDGSSTLVWEDPWIPDYPGFIPKPKEGNSPSNSMVVSQLFNESRFGWDDSKLPDLFESNCVVFIKKLPVLTNTPQDKWIWTKSTSGEFSIKSAYGILCNNADLGFSNPIWELIWKSHIHERLKMFLWRISSNLLPTKDNLDRFIDAEDQLCPLCEIEKESIIHIFLHYPVAKSSVVWELLGN